MERKRERGTGTERTYHAHFLHEPGNEVQFCKEVSAEKKKELLEKLVVYEVAELAKRNPQVAVDPASFVRTSTTRVPRQPREASSSRARQSTLDENWNPQLKEEVDMAVARFFFHDHIAFRVAR